jgi:hypothetical protein
VIGPIETMRASGDSLAGASAVSPEASPSPPAACRKKRTVEADVNVM